MVVISTSRKESSTLTVTLRYFKSEDVPIETDRTVQVRDFKMHMADADRGMDRARRRSL